MKLGHDKTEQNIVMWTIKLSIKLCRNAIIYDIIISNKKRNFNLHFVIHFAVRKSLKFSVLLHPTNFNLTIFCAFVLIYFSIVTTTTIFRTQLHPSIVFGWCSFFFIELLLFLNGRCCWWMKMKSRKPNPLSLIKNSRHSCSTHSGSLLFCFVLLSTTTEVTNYRKMLRYDATKQDENSLVFLFLARFSFRLSFLDLVRVHVHQ